MTDNTSELKNHKAIQDKPESGASLESDSNFECCDETAESGSAPAEAAESMDEDSILSFGRLDIDAWQGRIARILILLALCAQPLFVTPSDYVSHYLDLVIRKFAFFAIYMCIILFAVLLIWCSRLLRKPRLLPKGRLSIADWAILTFAAVTVLSAILSPYASESSLWIGRPERHDGAITQLFYIAIYFIISRWYRPHKKDFVIFGVSALTLSIIGIFQSYGVDVLDTLLSERTAELTVIINHLSTIGNTNFVSTYAITVALFFGFMYIKSTSKWQAFLLITSAICFWLFILSNADSGRVGLLAAFAFSVLFIVGNRQILGRFTTLGASWVLIYTLQALFSSIESRSISNLPVLLIQTAVFALLTVIGMFLIKFRKKDMLVDNDARIKWKLGLVLFTLIIATGFVGIEIFGRSENRGMIYEAREMLHGNFQDEFGTLRIFTWRHGLLAFTQHPIIGSGPDTFRSALSAEAHSIGMFSYGYIFDKAHNEYLQILVCQGILGLLSYLLFLGWIFIKSIPKAYKNPLVLATLIAVTGYLVQAFFNISMPIASQILWVLLGLLMNERVRSGEFDAPANKDHNAMPPVSD